MWLKAKRRIESNAQRTTRGRDHRVFAIASVWDDALCIDAITHTTNTTRRTHSADASITQTQITRIIYTGVTRDAFAQPHRHIFTPKVLRFN